MLRYTLYPVTVEVLAVHASATECVVACTPDPDNVIVAGDPAAVLVTVTVPVSVPATVGLKTTPNVRLCPTDSVTGALAPVSVKPVPLALICETVTPEFPEFVTVTFFVDDVPVFTLPKDRLVVLNVSARLAATPVPLNPTTAGEFGALLTMVTLPVTLPAAAGAN